MSDKWALSDNLSSKSVFYAARDGPELFHSRRIRRVFIDKICADFCCLWWQIDKIVLIPSIPVQVRHREAAVVLPGLFFRKPLEIRHLSV
jgi:hypothetical protein